MSMSNPNMKWAHLDDNDHTIPNDWDNWCSATIFFVFEWHHHRTAIAAAVLDDSNLVIDIAFWWADCRCGCSTIANAAAMVWMAAACQWYASATATLRDWWIDSGRLWNEIAKYDRKYPCVATSWRRLISIGRAPTATGHLSVCPESIFSIFPIVQFRECPNSQLTLRWWCVIPLNFACEECYAERMRFPTWVSHPIDVISGDEIWILQTHNVLRSPISPWMIPTRKMFAATSVGRRWCSERIGSSARAMPFPNTPDSTWSSERSDLSVCHYNVGPIHPGTMTQMMVAQRLSSECPW